MSHTTAEIMGAASIAFSRFSSMADKWWPKPTSSRESGTLVYNTYQITLSTTVPGGAIYYTTDGSVPTNINYEYSDGIVLTSGETIITARVYLDGKYSAPAAWSYNLVSLAPSIEHIEISDITAEGNLITVDYRDVAESEHIEISNITAAGSLIWAWSSLPVAAANIDDGAGNWGLLVQVTLDHPVTNVAGNGGAFVLTDTNGIIFSGENVSASEDGLTLTVTFSDFNSAAGACSVSYAPGTIQSPAVAMEAFSETFIPTGLVPTALPVPEVEAIWNE